MKRTIPIVLGSIWAVGLMIAALWLWQTAGSFPGDSDRGSAGELSMKAAAVAAGSAAQLVLFAVVVAQLYRRDVLSNVIRASAAIVFTVALVAAIIFAASGN